MWCPAAATQTCRQEYLFGFPVYMRSCCQWLGRENCNAGMHLFSQTLRSFFMYLFLVELVNRALRPADGLPPFGF